MALLIKRVRIVPALRGQIAVLRRERRTLEDEFQSRLADIAARAPVAESLQLVSAALLLPAPGPAE